MKVQVLIVLVFAATAWSMPKTKIPVVHPVFAKNWPSSRVVGGTEVKPHSIPYQVALFLGEWFCGGSILSKNWILTAAHCGELTNDPQIVAGAHNIRNVEDTQQIVNGEAPIIHPNWDSGNLRNDIALIKAKKPLELNSYVQPIPCAKASTGDLVGKQLTVSGWGKDADSATSISPVLREVTMPAITNAQCSQIYGSAIKETHLCCSTEEGKSSCSGDSGGPLTNSGTQVGIVSFGASAGCEKGYPAAFTRTSKFTDFIEQHTDVKCQGTVNF